MARTKPCPTHISRGRPPFDLGRDRDSRFCGVDRRVSNLDWRSHHLVARTLHVCWRLHRMADPRHRMASLGLYVRTTSPPEKALARS